MPAKKRWGVFDAYIETTEEHPFYVEHKGFIPAGLLAIGNSIVTRAGPPLAVESIVKKNQSAVVYNFSVDDFHTYFVGKSALWVHNECAGWHHFVLRSLGSGVGYGSKKILTYLDEIAHTVLHAELRAFLRTYVRTYKGKSYNMCPAKGNPGHIIQKAWNKDERQAALRAFYATFQNGTRLEAFEEELRLTKLAGKWH